MPHHNHLCLTEGGLEIIISKLNRIKSAIELCVYAFSNFYRTAINSYKSNNSYKGLLGDMAHRYLGRWKTSVICCIWASVMPSGTKPIERAHM